MIDKEKIEKEAKKIMDDFISALDKVPEIGQQFGQEREEQLRVPEKHEDSKEFRKRIFKNAPKVKDDYFVMEKKSW
jgi:Asp-tRNA(Asn)/Glu-tRNA(Gln) amidotransferase C subunit